MFDIVSLGHFSIDSIFLPDRDLPFAVLGGSVAYVSLSARRFDVSVSVISKVGVDFPKAYLWWLEQEGIDLSNVLRVDDAKTTSFELKYTKDLSDRKLKLKSKAPSIKVEDLPKPFRAKALHLAPIAGEISYEIVKELRDDADVLSLDPQGLLRSFDSEGNVTYTSTIDKRILELIDIYKSSIAELKVLTNSSNLKLAVKKIHDYGVKIVMVTSGMKGAFLSQEGIIRNLPAYKPRKLVDPTGAGDVFIGAFLAEYVHGKNSLWCACAGSAAASLVVEAAGPTFFGDKREIYRRADVLYEKEIKQ